MASSGFGVLTSGSPAKEFGIDEGLKGAVEHGLRVPRLVAGPMVLHAIVVQHVGTNLGPPAAIDLAAGRGAERAPRLLELVEAGDLPLRLVVGLSQLSLQDLTL